MTGSEKAEIEEVGDLKARDYGRRKRLGALLKSVESLNPKAIESHMEDFCTSKRKRGIGEINSCEVSAIPSKDSSQRDSPLSESSDRRLIGKTDRELEENEDGEGGIRSLKCVSHGWISVIGRRRMMEDAVAVAEFDSYQFFAVYDGHGGSGVANACRDRLHRLLEEEVEGKVHRSCGGGGTVEWEKVLKTCFRKMDEEVGGGRTIEEEEEEEEDMGEGGGNKAVALNTVGSTAVVVIVGEGVVVVANCGDSRAVLCRDGGFVPLSRDHKPDRPDERERVEAAGGRIINWNGSRVLGVLATSRSIGDHYLKPYVISEPEVIVWERTNSDQFLVIASDGLWDVVSNEFACEIVRMRFNGQIRRTFSDGLSGSNTAAEAAALLAELAIARGSKDNISVVVVDLRSFP